MKFKRPEIVVIQQELGHLEEALTHAILLARHAHVAVMQLCLDSPGHPSKSFMELSLQLLRISEAAARYARLALETEKNEPELMQNEIQET